MPYGAAEVGQGGACAEDAAAVVAGAVEIAARAGQQAVAFRQQGVVVAVVGVAVAAVHFDGAPAQGFEFVEQVALGGGGQVVAHGVGDDRDAARAVYCAHAVGQFGPLVGDGAGFAFAEVFGEGLLFVADVAVVEQEGGDVGAADHFRVGRPFQCAFVCAEDAFFFEFGGNGFESFQTAFSDFGQ